MPTIRGFVQKIDVGRAGLVLVTLVHADGSLASYAISDLDADPERFNERLSKLGVLRDAMNRAEPVEIEHSPGEFGAEIERAARISRDALGPVLKVTQVTGLVVDVNVTVENGIAAAAEKQDAARVLLLTAELASVSCVLLLQAPERIAAAEQLQMLLDAQAHGRVVRLMLDSSAAEARIFAVAVDNSSSSFGGQEASELDGFVESLGLLNLPFPGSSPTASNFASLRFTTAPPFVGAGNVIGTAPYTPVTLPLLVAKNSLAYALFEAGLRDNLRMRVRAALYGAGDDRRPGRDSRGGTPAAGGPSAMGETALRYFSGRLLTADSVSGTYAAATAEAGFALALGAELLAPLASASRPVWVRIARESLDHGPEAVSCTPGVPSSDLTPRGLRDLRLPYPATWKGYACCNDGVYRFQLAIPRPFELFVDDERLCVFDSDDPKVKFAYACLHGHHEVRIEIDGWTCGDEFALDVYRVR